MTEERKSLGKGLRALIREIPEVQLKPITEVIGIPDKITDKNEPIQNDEEFQWLGIAQITPGKYQPRENFNDDRIRGLADSIKEKGLIQPIVVKRVTENQYELIAGERRLRAAQQIGMERVPALVREVSEGEALELALIENIQREDLTPIEEAKAYQRLSTEFHLTHEEIGQKVGKDRPTISNAIRLLSLPHEIQQYLNEGKLQAGHARAILVLKDESEQFEFAHRVIRENWTVRQAERWAAPVVPKVTKTRRKKSYLAPNDPHLLEMEERLSKRFGTKVRIEMARVGGRMVIEFYSLEDFERITREFLGSGL